MTDLLINEHLGDYSIVELLGRGGMARVYRGYDSNLKRSAAVKVIDADQINIDMQVDYQTRFTREAQAIARLQHPNIVGVYQFGQSGSLSFMAMQYIEGRDLRQVLLDYQQQDQLLPLPLARTIMVDISHALDFAHAQGVIHRDVKPSNIMITPKGRAVLTDFGLVLDTIEGTIGSTFGSAQYISPEQAASSANAGPQSDLYSLGVVLYEMLAGRVPFTGETTMSIVMQHINDPPPQPTALNANINAATENVILRALQKRAEDRYSTGAEMVAALDRALGPCKPSATVPSTRREAMLATAPPPGWLEPTKHDTLPSHPRHTSRSYRRYLIVACVLLATILMVRAILTGSGQYSPGTNDERTAQIGAPATVISGTDIGVAGTSTTQDPLPITSTSLPTVLSSTTAGDVLLVYDSDTLIMVNQSGRTLNVSGLDFQRTDPVSGQLVRFQASDWRAGSASPRALPAGECFQVWRLGLGASPEEQTGYIAHCETRAAWRAVSELRWFWTSDQPESTFNVTQFGTLLATCTIKSGTCRFSF